MSLTNLNRFMRTLAIEIDDSTTVILKKKAKTTVSRAKLVHKYKNRSWNLTNQLKYRLVRRKKEVTFQSMYYGKWIISGEARTDGRPDNYIRNAWNYASRKFKYK